MDITNANILFITRAPVHGGTENVIIQLCEIFCEKANKIVVCAGAGFDRNRLRNLNVVFYEIPDIEDKNISTIYGVSKIICNIVKKEKINVIHTHHRMAAFYVSMLRLYRKCIFINTSHNIFFNKRLLTRFAYRKAILVACGDSVKDNLMNYFGLQNIHVIHNAIKSIKSLHEVDRQIAYYRQNGYSLVLNVARLSIQKGVVYYIESIPKVLKKYKNVVFFIAGIGELEPLLKQKVKELNIEDSVIFLGYRNDIQNIISHMDFVVLSSLWEGLPLTPIETFSVGKTIVATEIAGTTEIVKNNVNGILVKPADSKSLSMGILEMLEKDRTLLEKNAQKTFTTYFSFDILSEKYIKLYERC